jgi:hypothetical protein
MSAQEAEHARHGSTLADLVELAALARFLSGGASAAL